MVKRTKNILEKLSKLRKLLTPDSREIAIKRYLNTLRLASSGAAGVVLVQCVEDPYYYGLFGQIVSSLREQRPIRVEQFLFNSLRLGESSSCYSFIRIRFVTWLIGKKWSSLYDAFCDGVGYRSTSWRFPLEDLFDLYRAFVCWRSLTMKDALTSLVIDNVPVGDLINDSFLRYKPAPTVKLVDAYLWLIIWQAHRDIRRAKNYFTRVRPKLYLTSYSTYIQHGIAVRVALQCGVKVFSIFSNLQEFIKELSTDDWAHTHNPDAYADEFARMENADQKLVEADSALAARMAGAIDSATAYMRRSAYTESEDPVPDVRGALVIFLHDFFDSPHIYRHMVFPDFWEWICFTIDVLNRGNIRFFVKPHPNQIDLSAGVLNDLKRRYPDMLMISPNITNKQLAQAGMVCAVTVYGTVAHEMTYLGVPTIGCGDNPHVSFDFCKTAKNKEEYAELLIRYAEIEFDKLEMRRQSLAFYYMHNLNLSSEEKALMHAVSQYRKSLDSSTIHDQEVSELLINISGLSGYRSYINRLKAAIEDYYQCSDTRSG